MKANWLKFAGALSLTLVSAVLPGCSAGDMDEDFGADDSLMSEDMDLGSLEQHLMTCSNTDGTNSLMAAFAVATAQELKRWQATRDFVMFTTSGASESSPGMQQAIKLTSGTDSTGQPRGKSRCADGKCAKVQALLDMQYEQANNKVYLQGSSSAVLLNPGALRSRMVAKLSEQLNCDNNARDNDLTACPKEEHVLAYVSAAKGGCDTNFTFKATKTNGTALTYVNQLKNKLKFTDTANPYVSFTNLGGGNVSVDPTYGLNEDGSTSTGSCTAACTKVTTTSVAGQCCTCNGLSKKFVKAGWSATTYLCQ
jgi:hypothetical protein